MRARVFVGLKNVPSSSSLFGAFRPIIVLSSLHVVPGGGAIVSAATTTGETINRLPTWKKCVCLCRHSRNP
jgi:hypothetical protein